MFHVEDDLLFDTDNRNAIVVGQTKDGVTKQQLTIPATVLGKSVSEIGSGVFRRNSSITAISFSENIEMVGFSACQDCANLAYIYFPKSTNTIRLESNAFRRCITLTGLTILSPLEIGANAFADCINIRTVDVNARTIEQNAFSGCKLLHFVRLHGDVEIAPDAFVDCNNLSSIYITGDVVGSLDFMLNLNENVVIYCKKDSRLLDMIHYGYKVVANI